jgi:DNA-binding NarL/FixJ family response regulator
MSESSQTGNGEQTTSQPVRVVVADDHPIVRSGIRAELDAAPDVEVVGEAADGEEALEKSAGLEPDVLVLDINMPGMKARKVLHQLKALPSPPWVLILTVEEDVECVVAMLQAGATGYLVKDEHPRVIVDGVRAVARGQVWLSQAVLGQLVAYNLRERTAEPALPVTSREMDVLRLVAQGYYNEQIATALGIAEGTVKNHVTSLYDKLQVHSRAELVAYAWQHGVVGRD